MNLTELRPLFSRAIKNIDITKVTDQEIADSYINIAWIEVFESHRWESRKKTANQLLIPNYKTGTCSIVKYDGTNDTASKTVTFSTTLPVNIAGRYFRPKLSSNWNKIISVSGSTAYLDTPIVDVDTNGISDFEIWKRFYYAKSDVDVIYDFGKWGDQNLEYSPDAKLSGEIYDAQTTSGSPYNFTPYGVDPYDDVQYTTGTISAAKDSNVLTGSGTSWLSAGYDTGDIIEIGAKTFYVKRVETDTKIISFNTAVEAIDPITYKLRRNNPVGIQFYYPNDGYRILPYTYLCHAYPLIHPVYDRIQLPRRSIPAIVSRAVYYRMRDVDDQRMTSMLSIYEAELTSLKQKVRIVESRYDQFAPTIPRFMPGRYSGYTSGGWNQ